MNRLEALCCQCGHPRTVSGQCRFPLDDNRNVAAGTGTLKCSACGTKTRHAVIRDEKPTARPDRKALQKKLSVVMRAIYFEDFTYEELQAQAALLEPIYERSKR